MKSESSLRLSLCETRFDLGSATIKSKRVALLVLNAAYGALIRSAYVFNNRA